MLARPRWATRLFAENSHCKTNSSTTMPPSFDIAKLQKEHESAVASFLKMRSVDPAEVNAFVYGPYGGGSHVRSTLVAQWARSLTPAAGGHAFWQVIREQWATFDRIDHAEYQRQFRRFSPYWLLTQEVADLADCMMIYRGQSSLSRVGLSWSLSRDVAEGFARGHRGIPVPEPVVLERRIHRKQVALAVIGDRDEAEVVLWVPPR